MFEDSIFESTGSIHTRSRGWMLATFLLNSSILVGMILIPLIFPEALPHQAMSFLLSAPKTPPSQPPAPKEIVREVRGADATAISVILARPTLTAIKKNVPDGTSAPGDQTISMNDEPSVPGGTNDVFHGGKPAVVVHGETKGPVHVSSGVMSGALVFKTTPVYPAIGKAAGVEGTVVLLATSSKNGTIENLRVASGPAMLQQAAMDAVKTWRYKPYLLNGQPVEVETTVNVVFTLGR